MRCICCTNYFRYFEDQIPDRIFLKVILLPYSSARIFHVATKLENVRQERARGSARSSEMEKKRGKNLQEKNLGNIQNSLSLSFFFLSPLYLRSSTKNWKFLDRNGSSKRSYLILFLLQTFVKLLLLLELYYLYYELISSLDQLLGIRVGENRTSIEFQWIRWYRETRTVWFHSCERV